MTELDTSSPGAMIESCDGYLGERTGKYEWRRIRYLAALSALATNDLQDRDTVCDVGAGWTEFDYCLRVDGGSYCRYWPVDGSLDGTNLEHWVPPRKVEFFVALEIVEHLTRPFAFIELLQQFCTKAFVISTPNPRTMDVLGMDATHKTPIERDKLESWGFAVEEKNFYGQERDSLFAVWKVPNHQE